MGILAPNMLQGNARLRDTKKVPITFEVGYLYFAIDNTMYTSRKVSNYGAIVLPNCSVSYAVAMAKNVYATIDLHTQGTAKYTAVILRSVMVL